MELEMLNWNLVRALIFLKWDWLSIVCLQYNFQCGCDTWHTFFNTIQSVRWSGPNTVQRKITHRILALIWRKNGTTWQLELDYRTLGLMFYSASYWDCCCCHGLMSLLLHICCCDHSFMYLVNSVLSVLVWSVALSWREDACCKGRRDARTGCLYFRH